MLNAYLVGAWQYFCFRFRFRIFVFEFRAQIQREVETESVAIWLPNSELLKFFFVAFLF